jgi:hypothetical protein
LYQNPPNQRKETSPHFSPSDINPRKEQFEDYDDDLIPSPHPAQPQNLQAMQENPSYQYFTPPESEHSSRFPQEEFAIESQIKKQYEEQMQQARINKDRKTNVEISHPGYEPISRPNQSDINDAERKFIYEQQRQEARSNRYRKSDLDLTQPGFKPSPQLSSKDLPQNQDNPSPQDLYSSDADPLSKKSPLDTSDNNQLIKFYQQKRQKEKENKTKKSSIDLTQPEPQTYSRRNQQEGSDDQYLNPTKNHNQAPGNFPSKNNREEKFSEDSPIEAKENQENKNSPNLTRPDSESLSWRSEEDFPIEDDIKKQYEEQRQEAKMNKDQKTTINLSQPGYEKFSRPDQSNIDTDERKLLYEKQRQEADTNKNRNSELDLLFQAMKLLQERIDKMILMKTNE